MPSNVDVVFGANVRAELARRKVQNPVAARVVGVSPSTMSRRKGGTQPWTLAEAVAIAKFLGMSVDDLLEGE